MHPINLRVGGFYRAPTRAELAPLRELLDRTREDLLDAVRWSGALDFPDHEVDCEMVALSTGEAYPIESRQADLQRRPRHRPGRVHRALRRGADRALDRAARPDPRARGNYMVGPMARYSLNSGLSPPAVRQAASEAGLGDVCRNPFRSIVVRCVEMLFAGRRGDPADRLLRAAGARRRRGRAAGRSRLRLVGGAAGNALAPLRARGGTDGPSAPRSSPPTSQNQASIELDLRGFVAANLDLGDDELRLRCEQAVRNYDPCISCSTHFLRLEIERS